jgi:uncharacterized protein (TIGR02001 family)
MFAGSEWKRRLNNRPVQINEVKKGYSMRTQIMKIAALGVAMQALAFAVPAMAQDASKADDSGAGITVSGGVAVVSDYRFRGVSLSNKDVAVQPTLTVKHGSGLYVGAWGSNIAPNGGDDVEVDLFAGYAGGGDALSYDVSATYYVFPGASGFNYAEFTGKVGTTVGPASLGAQVSYVPEQGANTLNLDNIYVGTNASIGIPTTPLTLTASVGYEDGAFGSDKVDWSLGATAEVAGFTLGASYVDTNRFIPGTPLTRNNGGAGAVFSIGYNF